jgi:hypothetical protein
VDERAVSRERAVEDERVPAALIWALRTLGMPEEVRETEAMARWLLALVRDRDELIEELTTGRDYTAAKEEMRAKIVAALTGLAAGTAAVVAMAVPTDGP